MENVCWAVVVFTCIQWISAINLLQIKLSATTILFYLCTFFHTFRTCLNIVAFILFSFFSFRFVFFCGRFNESKINVRFVNLACNSLMASPWIYKCLALISCELPMFYFIYFLVLFNIFYSFFSAFFFRCFSYLSFEFVVVGFGLQHEHFCLLLVIYF